MFHHIVFEISSTIDVSINHAGVGNNFDFKINNIFVFPFHLICCHSEHSRWINWELAFWNATSNMCLFFAIYFVVMVCTHIAHKMQNKLLQESSRNHRPNGIVSFRKFLFNRTSFEWNCEQMHWIRMQNVQ